MIAGCRCRRRVVSSNRPPAWTACCSRPQWRSASARVRKRLAAVLTADRVAPPRAASLLAWNAGPEPPSTLTSFHRSSRNSSQPVVSLVIRGACPKSLRRLWEETRRHATVPGVTWSNAFQRNGFLSRKNTELTGAAGAASQGAIAFGVVSSADMFVGVSLAPISCSSHTGPNHNEKSWSNLVIGGRKQGAPGRIRTSDTWFRKPLLYPLSYEGGMQRG